MEFFKPGRTFDFMGKRWFWIPFSLFLVFASTVSLFWPGPNYGTDFRGGTEIEVAFKQAITVEKVRTAIENLHYATPDIVQVVGQQPNQYLIRVQEVSVLDDALRAKLKDALCLTEDTRTPAADPKACPENARATEVKFSQGGDKIDARYENTPDLDKVRAQVKSVDGVSLRDSTTNIQETNARDHRVEIQLESKGDQLMNGLLKELGPDVVPEHPLRVEWVGPKAGAELRASARNSVAIAIVFIMLYLAFRFDLRFAPGVVVASVHDAMVVIGFFVVFQKEITLSTIAAVLTIVGYSMNDTVVIYDRIRENLAKHRGRAFGDIINLSVSETLSRTILTSGATLLSVIPFFIWGTGVIKDFALAMVVGIIAGTYSSIYVAAPLTEWIDSRLTQSAKKKKKGRKVLPAAPVKI